MHIRQRGADRGKMMANELTARPAHKWVQEYRGVNIEISHHGMTDKPDRYDMNDGYGTWCYYIFLNEEQFPDNQFDAFWLKPEDGSPDNKGRVFYDYYVSPLSDLEWHGGITFYSKTSGFDGAMRVVKLGCDFNHSWDEGHHHWYDKDYIWSQACKTVDALHVIFPNMLTRCAYMGTYHKLEDMVEVKPGIFYSNEGKKKSDEYAQKRVLSA